MERFNIPKMDTNMNLELMLDHMLKLILRSVLIEAILVLVFQLVELEERHLAMEALIGTRNQLHLVVAPNFKS